MGFRSPNRLFDLINLLGLTSGLKLCLDAGDAASYTSGQSWLDTSGNGYDFFRGTTSGSAADDPTFNGAAGAKSTNEYWSFDGGDLFRYDSTNETWMQNIHKDNAKYTFVAWIYAVTGVNNIVAGNNGGTSGTGTGFHFGTPSTNNVTMRAANGVGSEALNKNSVATVTNGAWNFIAASVDEATGTGYFQCNGTQETFSSTYNTPSSGNASFTTEIGARGNGNSPMPSGSRIAMVAVWEGVFLSQAQINSIYTAIVTHQKTATGNVSATASRGSAVSASRRANVSCGAVAVKFLTKSLLAGIGVGASAVNALIRAVTLSATGLASAAAARSVVKICRSNVSNVAALIKAAAFTKRADTTTSPSIAKESALTLAFAGVTSVSSTVKQIFKLATARCGVLAGMVLKFWMQRPEQPESWTQAATQSEPWVERSKVSELWSNKSAPSTPWTERPKSNEPWS